MRNAAAVTLLSITLASPARAAADPQVEKCMGQRYENEIRACLDGASRQADHEMAVSLEKALSYGDAEHAAMLRKSQAAFLSYRDAECAAEGDTMRGGTLDSDDDAACVVEKDRGRAAELENDLELMGH